AQKKTQWSPGRLGGSAMLVMLKYSRQRLGRSHAYLRPRSCAGVTADRVDPDSAIWPTWVAPSPEFLAHARAANPIRGPSDHHGHPLVAATIPKPALLRSYRSPHNASASCSSNVTAIASTACLARSNRTA